MRRTWVISGLVVVAVIAGAAVYQRGLFWREFKYLDTRLMADLGQPDALIRTASLSKLPRDLLRVPIARDVLTEDLAFYYEQHEDRLGLKGAVKRIAYEHQLDWTDRIVASALDEPAEVALWRDGKGALRHFAIVMQRNALGKVLQEGLSVALKDRQLTLAGEIETARGKANVFALEINPRRTLLIAAVGERIVVLSDPGLLFDKGKVMVPTARAAVAEWLEAGGALSKRFALDEGAGKGGERPLHTLVIGAPALSLGYGSFVPGFRGVRFDFGSGWSTSVWIDPKELSTAGLGDAALWRAVPANPSACLVLPVDWRMAQKVVAGADKKPALADANALAALEGSGLVCWYGNSTLYAPVFVAKLSKGLPDRNAALQALANWALAKRGADVIAGVPAPAKEKKVAAADDTVVWRAAKSDAQKTAAPAAVGARGSYVVFSPDGALVDLVFDTLSRRNPSVADQMPVSNATLALITPRPLSGMVEREALDALSGAGDANLHAAAQTHLPARMKALAAYPPYRLELSSGKAQGSWQRVEWRTPVEKK